MHDIYNMTTSRSAIHDTFFTITPYICNIVTTAGLTPPT